MAIDANTITDSGCWAVASLSPSTYNVPYNYGILVHFETKGYYKAFQAFMSQQQTNRFWVRLKDSDSTWKEWLEISNFGCSTLAELKAALANV